MFKDGDLSSVYSCFLLYACINSTATQPGKWHHISPPLPVPQVGFNAGNGSSAYPYTPYSQTMYIRDLTSTGMANGFPGRHIFRVDEKILAGNCRHELCAYSDADRNYSD